MSALMRRLSTLAGMTIRELLRQHVLYLILIPAILILMTLPFFAVLTFEEQIKFMRDFCFGIMSFFGIFLAIIATAQSVAFDIEQKTILMVLAKPIGRWEYLMGKGIGMTIIVGMALMILGFFSVILFAFQESALIQSAIDNATHPLTPMEIEGLRHQLWSPVLLGAVGILYLKLILMIGFTLLLSTIATSSLFTIFTAMMIYGIGFLQSTAREWIIAEEGLSSGVKGVVGFLSVIMPDMSFYEGADRILLGASFTPAMVIHPLGYTFFNLLWLLALSSAILESRKFR